MQQSHAVKSCPDCGRILPLTSFYKNRRVRYIRGSDGNLTPYTYYDDRPECKRCTKHRRQGRKLAAQGRFIRKVMPNWSEPDPALQSPLAALQSISLDSAITSHY
jgi:hypothetical protein